MKKLTAVEWLVDELTKNGHNFKLYKKEIKQAKELEKQQIIDAWDKGDFCIDLPDGTWEQKYKSGEQYYTETFKK